MKLRPVLLSDEIGGGDYHTKLIKVTLYNFLMLFRTCWSHIHILTYMYQFIWWSIPTVFTHHPTHPFFFYLTPSHNIRMWSYPPVHTLKRKKNHALNNDLYLLRLYCLLEVPVSWQHTKQKNLERDAPQQIDGERHRKQRQLNSF